MGKLTATEVKAATQKEKPYKLTDGRGLYLFVNKAGKYWRYDYRYQKKRKTLALGVYPEVSLKDARNKLEEARRILNQGSDPAFIRKVSKVKDLNANDRTFEKYAWEWYAKKKWTTNHRRTVKSRLENYILPWIGNIPVDKISAQDVLLVCRRVEEKGAIETAVGRQNTIRIEIDMISL
jgi:hypothetical protein